MTPPPTMVDYVDVAQLAPLELERGRERAVEPLRVRRERAADRGCEQPRRAREHRVELRALHPGGGGDDGGARQCDRCCATRLAVGFKI